MSITNYWLPPWVLLKWQTEEESEVSYRGNGDKQALPEGEIQKPCALSELLQQDTVSTRMHLYFQIFLEFSIIIHFGCRALNPILRRDRSLRRVHHFQRVLGREGATAHLFYHKHLPKAPRVQLHLKPEFKPMSFTFSNGILIIGQPKTQWHHLLCFHLNWYGNGE